MALGRIPMKAYYGADLLQNSGIVPVEFLLIFDQRTGRLAAPDGVLVVGSPSEGNRTIRRGPRNLCGRRMVVDSTTCRLGACRTIA